MTIDTFKLEDIQNPLKPSQLVNLRRMGPEQKSHMSIVTEITSRTHFWTQR